MSRQEWLVVKVGQTDWRPLAEKLKPAEAGLLLCRLGYLDDGLPILRELLKDPSYQVRQEAARVLGEIGAGDDRVIAGLIDASKDQRVCVSGAAVKALLKIDAEDEHVITAMIRLLEAGEF